LDKKLTPEEFREAMRKIAQKKSKGQGRVACALL
jgi:hypothetical protein